MIEGAKTHCESCHGHDHPVDPKQTARVFWTSLLFTIPLWLMMFGLHIPVWAQLVCATIVQIVGGWPFYKSSFRSALHGEMDMDLLIALGTTAAYGFSLYALYAGNQPLYFESSATIITLVLLGRLLEANSRKKAGDAIGKLLALQPQTVRLIREGVFQEVPIQDIHSNDLFVVRPGENIAVDGVVVEGDSSVNESLLTGESMPVLKSKDDLVYGGTNNLNGSLTIQAKKVGSDTALAGIVRLVEGAQNSRAPVQGLADQVSEVFIPAIILIALATFIGWYFYSGVVSQALINAVSVLVISCPCALGLATPTVISVASGLGAKQGILFKEAGAIEQAGKIETLVVDKTGTLTLGEPKVTGIYPVNGMEENRLLAIAYALENKSLHPIAEAIQAYGKDKEIFILSVAGFSSVPGKGVSGNIQGEQYTIGSIRFAQDLGLELPIEEMSRAEQKGETIAALWNEKEIIGFITVSDQLRKNSVKAMALINRMGIHTVMLTGDHPQTAKAIAYKAGIQEFYADVLPEFKAKKVQELKERGQIVGMVGDGINDAPALASSSVGFAIGAGSDVAIEASDVTLLKNDLMGVVEAIDLSKQTMRKAKQNLFFAFIYNLLGIPLAALGLLTPEIAAGAMALSSLSVVSNALLLRNWKLGN